MNDLFYEIIMKYAVLIAGSCADVSGMMQNLILSVLGMFPESVKILDLSGQSSKYARFAPVCYRASDMLDMFRQLAGRFDSTDGATTPEYVFINNMDYIINSMYGTEKRQFLALFSDLVFRGQSANIHIICTADKFNLSCFSGIACRAYAGKCDKKTALKFFGSDAGYIRNGYFPDLNQALIKIDDTIYLADIPEIQPETLTDCAFSVCNVQAEEEPEPEQEQPEEPAPEADTNPAEQPEARNMIERFIEFIMMLLSGAVGFIQDAKKLTDSKMLVLLYTFVQFQFSLALAFFSVLHAIAHHAPFAIVCAGYMLIAYTL